jgi:hypothetical protein
VCVGASNGQRGQDWLTRGQENGAKRSRRRECGSASVACCCDCARIRSIPAPHGAPKCSREVCISARRYHRTPDERLRRVGKLHHRQSSISPPMLLPHANVRARGGSRLAWTMLRSMSAAEPRKTSLTTCAGGCMHLCARVCVDACVDQFRACVHVGTWVDAGLCVPMTVISANNAIATILKFDFFSGRIADLHVFLHSWCTLHAVVRV